MQILSTFDAQATYKSGDAATRKLLESIFGADKFQQKITDRVKNVRNACEVLNIERFDSALGSLPGGVEQDRRAIEAFAQLTIITRALNEGWQPDWENTNQRKWYPYFKMRSGFGFSDTGYGIAHADAAVGSRLCFKTRALAEYAGKTFTELYKDYMLLS